MKTPCPSQLRRATRRGFLGATASLAAATALAPAAQAAPATGRHPHKYEELLPEEFYAELERAPIVYIPSGAPEEHGLQNVLAVDPWTAYETCLRAVKLTGGIVYPIVPFAPAGFPQWSREQLRSGNKDTAPPSCWISRETCELLYTELMESLADLGFKACLAFCGHAPGDALLQDIEKQHAGVIRGMRFWGGGTVRILKDELAKMGKEQPLLGGHGMMWETSIVMALNEHWVDLDRVARIKDSPLSHQLKNQSPERLAAIRTANAELGQRMLNLAAERLAEVGRQLLAQKVCPPP
jgi:creatinine amidohydrolase/Fe(II)-dependent formamide hydrolase-like protein